VLGHQAAHRGAVALVVILLQPEGVLPADLEIVRDVVADALVDLLPKIDMMRIERVVEIEHPGVDPVERARGRARRSSRHDTHRIISVPAPWSVSNSSSTACGTRPSRITTPSTPASSA